ncbi:hypothetical protein BJ944DRAFT_83733 [Cunninghamella echinulata]|nr:hypothetical protein BJ944DRAFT_83733 [Cunninghamella echinulata]
MYCDQELYSVIRSGSPSSPIPSPQSSTKSVRDTIRQLNRRKSISAFNKILSGSVQANFVKPPSPPRLQQQQQRPKSAAFHQELSTVSSLSTSSQRDDQKSAIMHSFASNNSNYKNKNGLVTPNSSFLNYRANAIKHQKTPSQSDILSRKTPSPVQQGNNNSKNDIVAGSYRPSVHPSQTMSYEIKVNSRFKKN